MKNILGKLTDFNPDGKNCKNCGHHAVLHHTKMEPKNGLEKFSFKIKRFGCRRYECEQFK